MALMVTMPSKPFARELAIWRHNLRLTQTAACERLDVPLRTYQQWEQGRHAPANAGAIRRLMATIPPLERRKRKGE